MSNFHPLEVVDRGSEKQLQVSENFKALGLIFTSLTSAGDSFTEYDC